MKSVGGSLQLACTFARGEPSKALLHSRTLHLRLHGPAAALDAAHSALLLLHNVAGSAELEGAAEGMLAPRTLRPRPVSEWSPCLALDWFLSTEVKLTGDRGGQLSQVVTLVNASSLFVRLLPLHFMPLSPFLWAGRIRRIG